MQGYCAHYRLPNHSSWLRRRIAASHVGDERSWRVSGGREEPAASEREGQHSACCEWNKTFFDFHCDCELAFICTYQTQAHDSCVVIDAIFYVLASPIRRDLAKPKRDSFPRGSVLTIASSPEDLLVIRVGLMFSLST